MTARKSLYRILDVGLLLQTDSEDFYMRFDREYGFFKAPSIEDCKRLLSFCLYVHEGKKDPRLSINDEPLSLRNHPAPLLHAYQALLHALFGNIQDFLVAHAGVVAVNDFALILAGLPGAGKTSLVLELLKQGFSFYSDDFCPIDKISGMIHPFPRSAWKSLPFDPCRKEDSAESILRAKESIPPHELGADVGKGPCRAKWLIYLDASDEATDRWCELVIQPKTGSCSGFISDVRKFNEALLEDSGEKGGLLRIKYQAGRGLAAKLKLLLKKHEQSIWDVYRFDPIRPDFAADPVLLPIPPSQAAFSLMQDLKAGASFEKEGALLAGSAMGVFMHLGKLLENVSCYRLRVGKFQTMLDLILRIVHET